MATIHLSGTQLAPQKQKVPLNRKFLAVLALLFGLAMHLFMPNPGGSGLELPFNAAIWAVFSFAFAIGLYQLGTSGELRYTKLSLASAVAASLMTLPILYSNANIFNALPTLVGLWAGILFLLVLQQFQFSNKHKQRLLWFIVIAALIQAGLGWYQFLWLEPVNWMNYNTATNRPYGIFQQPNVMASFLATGVVISGYLLARHPHKYHRSSAEISLLFLSPIMSLPLLVVLGSRTGWIGTALGIALILPYLYQFGSKRRFWAWFVALAAGLAIALPFISIQQESNTTFIAQKLDLDSIRSETYLQTLDMLIEKPLTGYGLGNFESAYTLYTARQHALNPSYPAGYAGMDHPHNEVLFWGVSGGVVPLLGIFLISLILANKLIRARKGTRLALLALFIPIALHSQLEYPFYHSSIHWITFIILIYWLDQRGAKVNSIRFSVVTKTATRSLSLVLPVGVTFFMVTLLHSNYVLSKYESEVPSDITLLDQVSNTIAWQNRINWNRYTQYLQVGLITQAPEMIKPYVNWALQVVKETPRPDYYQNLILAYQALGEESKAEQIRAEASFLFPRVSFDHTQYEPPLTIEPATSKSIETLSP